MTDLNTVVRNTVVRNTGKFIVLSTQSINDNGQIVAYAGISHSDDNPYTDFSIHVVLLTP